MSGTQVVVKNKILEERIFRVKKVEGKVLE